MATLWFNRPDKRNALSYEMWTGIPDACGQLASDAGVRVLVVRGVGEHFCAGADISTLGGLEPGVYAAANEAAETALASFPKPTIAAITGSCMGGGCQLALACDLRFADTTARFGITPARLGIVYPAYSVERTVRIIGPSATKHLLFSGEHIDASRALRIGLVDEVHEPDDLPSRVSTFARTLATERSLLTQQASKQLVDQATLGSVDASLVRRWADDPGAAAEAAEGIAAFLERRPPRFTWTGA